MNIQHGIVLTFLLHTCLGLPTTYWQLELGLENKGSSKEDQSQSHYNAFDDNPGDPHFF